MSSLLRIPHMKSGSELRICVHCWKSAPATIRQKMEGKKWSKEKLRDVNRGERGFKEAAEFSNPLVAFGWQPSKMIYCVRTYIDLYVSGSSLPALRRFNLLTGAFPTCHFWWASHPPRESPKPGETCRYSFLCNHVNDKTFSKSEYNHEKVLRRFRRQKICKRRKGQNQNK